ncbi:MAG: hypothetical protein WCT03_14945, partial [Candidatus Obscuribacterales bacterium]
KPLFCVKDDQSGTRATRRTGSSSMRSFGCHVNASVNSSGFSKILFKLVKHWKSMRGNLGPASLAALAPVGFFETKLYANAARAKQCRL